jgi:hypothetical protein
MDDDRPALNVGDYNYVEDEEWTAWTINVGMRLDRQDKKILIGIGLGAIGTLVGAFSLKAIAKLASGLAPVMEAINAQQASMGVPTNQQSGPVMSKPESSAHPTSEEPASHEETVQHGPAMTPIGVNGAEVIDESRLVPEGSIVAPPDIHGAPMDLELGDPGDIDPMASLLREPLRPAADAVWVDPGDGVA